MQAYDEDGATLTLTGPEALVLLEWLANRSDADEEGDDPAALRVLWDLEATLESQLVATFAPNYSEVLALARAKVLGQGD